MSSYRNTRGRRRGAGADAPPESNDAVAGQRQPQSPRQQGSFEDLAGTGTANPAPRCGPLALLVEIQGLGGGARGPAGTLEVYQPDKSVVASRLSAHAFAIPGLEALSPSPPGAKLKASKALRLAGIRDSAQRQVFYAQHEVDVPDAKAKCCSLEGAPELITGFWRGKNTRGILCHAARCAQPMSTFGSCGPPVPQTGNIARIRYIAHAKARVNTIKLHQILIYCAEVLWWCAAAGRRTARHTSHFPHSIVQIIGLSNYLQHDTADISREASEK